MHPIVYSFPMFFVALLPSVAAAGYCDTGSPESIQFDLVSNANPGLSCSWPGNQLDSEAMSFEFGLHLSSGDLTAVRSAATNSCTIKVQYDIKAVLTKDDSADASLESDVYITALHWNVSTLSWNVVASVNNPFFYAASDFPYSTPTAYSISTWFPQEVTIPSAVFAPMNLPNDGFVIESQNGMGTCYADASGSSSILAGDAYQDPTHIPALVYVPWVP